MERTCISNALLLADERHVPAREAEEEEEEELVALVQLQARSIAVGIALLVRAPWDAS
jgi:hypothetical protein